MYDMGIVWRYLAHGLMLQELLPMLPLQITRRRKPNTEPKQALRAHVEQLPLDQQQAFVAIALQLLHRRIELRVVEKTSSYRRPHHERLQ